MGLGTAGGTRACGNGRTLCFRYCGGRDPGRYHGADWTPDLCPGAYVDFKFDRNPALVKP